MGRQVRYAQSKSEARWHINVSSIVLGWQVKSYPFAKRPRANITKWTIRPIARWVSKTFLQLAAHALSHYESLLYLTAASNCTKPESVVLSISWSMIRSAPDWRMYSACRWQRSLAALLRTCRGTSRCGSCHQKPRKMPSRSLAG